MNYRYYILSIFVVFFSNGAMALSCSPAQSRLFAECSKGVCENFLYVVEVSSYSQCSRRPAIKQPPSWAKEVFEFEIDSHEPSSDKGVYELVLERSYWQHSYLFSNAEEYRLYHEKTKQKEYPLAVLKRITGQSIEELEIEWKLKAKKEYRKMLISKVLDWLVLIIASLCLVYSILWFYKWQKSLISIKWVILAIGIQALIFAAALTSISTWSMSLIAFLGIFIPGVWLYQVTIFMSLWWSNRPRI